MKPRHRGTAWPPGLEMCPGSQPVSGMCLLAPTTQALLSAVPTQPSSLHATHVPLVLWFPSTLSPSPPAFSPSCCVGNTLIGGGPAAYVADISSRSQRPQALAILRSAGDLGLMMGASVLGTVSDVASLEAVFGCAAAMILSSGAYFAFNAEESVGRRRALPGAKPMGTRALGPDAEEPQATSEKWGNGAAHRNANKTLRSKNWAEIP